MAEPNAEASVGCGGCEQKHTTCAEILRLVERRHRARARSRISPWNAKSETWRRQSRNEVKVKGSTVQENKAMNKDLL